MCFIPGWKDLLKTLWILLLFGGWAWIAERIMESGIPRQIATNHPLILTVVVLFFFVFPLCSIALIHHFLFGKQASKLPAWMPTASSWWEAIWVYMAVILGMIIPVFVGLGLILVWNSLLQFSVIDLVTTIEQAGNSDLFIGALGFGSLYVIALVMKLQRWSNRPKEKPPAATEGNTK